jgi:phytoene dehydrogenase-like protein
MTDQIVIIGGGHNALVCAAYLAKAGRDVTVLEAAEQVGGLAVTREFTPGFRVSAAAHLLYLLDRDVRRDLGLDKAGLALSQTDVATTALAADGNHLLIKGDTLQGADIGAKDRAAMPEYRRLLGRFARVVNRLNNRVPPRIGTRNASDWMTLAKTALDIRRLGRDDMREFLRIAGINIHDVLEEFFESPLLKGALSMDGVLGTHLGPRSSNSVFCALQRWSGLQPVAVPAGGMGSVTAALARAATGFGVDIRTSAGVARILVEHDRASGVQLESGEKIAARAVVSGADPKTTFLELLGARYLEAGFTRRIMNLRMRGNAAKLHLALDGLPEFKGVNQDRLGDRLLIAPDMQYVDRAFNHAKYGEFSAQPVFEITIPSARDHGLAPSGKHVLSAVVQYAPYGLREGWQDGKEAFTEIVFDTLARYAPGIRGQVIGHQLLTPADIEREFRVAGGHWHHVELALDQALMLRPAPGTAQYVSPVDGLYLCGAGSHPGGGVMGSAGRNAAQAVLAGANDGGQKS